MTAAGTILGLRWRLRRFACDREGVSAVEFAIILPFMVMLYIGGVELGDGSAIQFKTAFAARTVADLTSQYVSVDSSTVSSILGAAATVVSPYSSSGMVVTVSEVTTTNSTGKATITWSCSLSGTPHTYNQSFTLPSALQTLPTNTSLILGELTFPYTPQIGYVLTGTINIYHSAYFYPRLTTSVSPQALTNGSGMTCSS